MIETRIAKLFKNGASQAVRLPAEFLAHDPPSNSFRIKRLA